MSDTFKDSDLNVVIDMYHKHTIIMKATLIEFTETD